MIEQHVYRLLVGGLCAVQIAKKLQKSKGYISKVVRKLEQGGYVICINPKEKPRFYTSTRKVYNGSKFPPLLPKKETRLSHRLLTVEIQKSSFTCDVLIPPTKAKWDSCYEWRPGVMVFQYVHPFKDVGEVRFRRFVSESRDRLMIILPRLLVKKEEVAGAEELLAGYARMAASWLKKRFDMPLGDVVLCQKPHYAVPALEPELVEALRKRSFKVGEMMADTSPPDCIAEVESTDGRDVVNYLESVSKIKVIEERLCRNGELLSLMLKRLDGVSVNQESIVRVLDGVIGEKVVVDEDCFVDVV